MPTPNPQTSFPRAYLLNIYNMAITHGHILIHPISETKARSLTLTLYRLRRRSDRANASFITPEMHLVTVGRWRPDNGGTLPIYFNTSDEPLPTITPVDDPNATHLPLPTPNFQGLPPGPAPLSPTSQPPDLAEDEIDAYIANLVRKSHGDD